jgi:hypothetical protein
MAIASERIMGSSSRLGATAQVILDERPGRNNTVVGKPLLMRLVRRVILLPIVAAAATSLPFATRAMSLQRLAGVYLIVLVGFFAMMLIAHGTAVYADYQEKKRLGPLYGCTIRVGLDAHQERATRVRSSQGDLSDYILSALKSLSDKVDVHHLENGSFEARIPRAGGKWLRCTARVRVEHPSNDEAVVVINSQLSSWLGFTDVGRNIIIVEEFSRALKVLIESGGQAQIKQLEW